MNTIPSHTVHFTSKDSSHLAACYTARRVCQDKGLQPLVQYQLKPFRSLLALLTIRSQIEACCQAKLPRLVLTDLRRTHATQNCRLLTVASSACIASFKLPSKSSSSVIAFAYILHTSDALMMKNHPKKCVHLFVCMTFCTRF